MAREDKALPAIMQRQNERGRVVVDGKRTDDGERCSLLVVREVGGTCALYPHGAIQLGVRLTGDAAAAVAEFLSGGAP